MTNCKGQECERDAERDGYCRLCWATHQANGTGKNWRKIYTEARDKIESELGPVVTCQKCRQKAVEMEAPGFWCRFCWASWWADGMSDDRRSKEWHMCRDEVLANMQRDYGDPENNSGLYSKIS